MSGVRRTLKWSALGLLALAAAWAIFRSSLRVAEAAPEIVSSRLLLTLLTIAIAVLALGFVGVLIRNLVRLIVDRKRGILGARLRTKLVFFFLALVLLPAFVLSFGAAAFIKTTVEGLLRTPVEEVTRQAKEIVKEEGRREEARLVRHAKLLAGDLAGARPIATEAERDAVVVEWREREGFDVAGCLSGEAWFVAGSAAAGRGGRVTDPLRAALLRVAQGAARSGTTLFEEVPVGQSVALVGAAPMGPSGAPRGAAIVGEIVGRATALRLDQIDAADRAYAEYRAERREVLNFYYLIITLVGLAVVFVSSWIGFYVSRRITVPLEQVAAASREISQGNLGVRVLTEVGDEVGMLVEAFNEMAGELQESREVITRNTAELRRSNQALDERRRYVETLVAHLSTAVLSLDRDGRVTTANPAVATMLSLRLSPGDDARAAIAGTGLDPLRVLLDDAAARDGKEERRELVLSAGSRPLAVTVQVSPLRGAQGDDLGTLVMVEDLTDLLEAQRAAAWREVARRIAHEIKNPLTPIQLAAQRLRKKFADGAPDLAEVVTDSTATIEREVAGLKKLVDEFSLYARMPGPSPQPVDFREVVDSVVALYRVHSEIAWDVRVASDLGTVRVDPEQMRRALINLIDNAVAAMAGVGTITIAARPWAGPGSLRVEVADRGPGVTEAARDHLFTPYYSTKPRGTGLGLAIVQRVVVEHRGTVRVEDNPGGGTRFVIEIPGSVPAAEAVSPAPGGHDGA